MLCHAQSRISVAFPTTSFLETAMKTLFLSVALGAGFLLSAGAFADAPAGAIAQCKDGTYFTGTSHNGACKGHQGVKEWLDKTSDAKSGAAAKTTAADTPAPKAAPAAPKAKATPAAATTSVTPPAGAIAKCKDGTFFSGASHKGACRGHKGVADWLDGGATAATPATKSTPAAAPAAPAPKAAPAAAPTPAAAAPAAASESKRTPPTPASQITAKAGGGPGLVWVNSGSKVYHCQGDEWYGKTKEGSYMSEAAAKSGGNRAAAGKECTQ
jgi:Protein of unknown function (DUF3761)